MWQSNDEVETLLAAAAQQHYRRAAGGRASRPAATSHDEAMRWRALAEQGWLALVLPEAWGGAGLGLRHAAALTRVMGEHVAREPYIACALLPGLLVAAIDTPNVVSVGEAIAGGQARHVVAWQESGTTLDAVAAGVTATAHDDGMRVSGRKSMVAGWQSDATMLVIASCDGDAVLLRVEADERIAADICEMADGSYCADVAFAEVLVPNDDILARGPAVARALRIAVDGSLLTLCAYLEGLAAGALALTVDYVRQRRQFDQPIAEFQAIRHRIANVAMGVELAGASWRRALTELTPAPTHEAMPWTLSAAKIRAADVALLAAREGVQFHGAFGYTEEADIGQYLAAGLRAASWLGNSAEHRRLVAHHNPTALSIHA